MSLPYICKRCLDTNSQKSFSELPGGHQCSKCIDQYTAFKWKTLSGEIMKTHLCFNCAQKSSACQVCGLDVVYFIPVELRDRTLKIITLEGGDINDNGLVRKIMDLVREEVKS
ncbi:Ecm2 protein [Starmerella bacillaris]|uniref:Pre-mRNA-splicing factor SLT11 n=1 Tax=Starmerella bacillaris TaxID=1247836 RepID=A0AAV5REP9_STABA|nr:Ecm2 protein [Starmerella bacillaris]